MSRTITIAGVAGAMLVLTVSVAYGAVGRDTSASLSGPFIGTYAAKLSLDQAADRGDARMAGRFRLVLRKNGTYTASNPLDGAANGRLAALAGKRLRFFDDNGCMAGGFERPKGGIYSWSVNDGKLTLRLVSEGPCWGRTQSLTYPVWNRR